LKKTPPSSTTALVAIFSLSAIEKTINQLNVSFGCIPIKINDWKTPTEALDIVRNICLEKNLAKKGDRVIIVAGAHTEKDNLKETNSIIVETI
jgi:pyruvate kinase